MIPCSQAVMPEHGSEFRVAGFHGESVLFFSLYFTFYPCCQRCVCIRILMRSTTPFFQAFGPLLFGKGCLDTVRQFANATCGAEDKPRTISCMVDEMLLAIARDLTPHRPGRSEPRVRKRRPRNCTYARTSLFLRPIRLGASPKVVNRLMTNK